MHGIARDELAKVPYLDAGVSDDRVKPLMPFWDGQGWSQWFDTADRGLIEFKPIDTVRSTYIASAPAKASDLFLPFVDFMWQRASWQETWRLVHSICDDFHMLGASSAKLRHFFDNRHLIDDSLLASFVQSELEYMLTVARSVFDLLQEILSDIWNKRVRLHDAVAEARRRKLPPTFSKVVLENNRIRSAGQIAERFGLPTTLAASYSADATTFAHFRTWRDRIVHGGSSVDVIFVTEKGFCVDPSHAAFREFTWTEAHRYNEAIVSLLPWVANIVGSTVGACTRMVEALAGIVAFPPEVAPGYRVFLRDPVNEEFAALRSVLEGELVWWTDGVLIGQ